MDQILQQLQGINLNILPPPQRNTITIEDLISGFSNASINKSSPTNKDVEEELEKIAYKKEDIIKNIDEYKVSLQDFKRSVNDYRANDPNFLPHYDCVFVPDEYGYYFTKGEQIPLSTSRIPRTKGQKEKNPEMVEIMTTNKNPRTGNPIIGKLILYGDDNQYYVLFKGDNINGNKLELIPGSVVCPGNSEQKKARRPDRPLYIPPALRAQMMTGIQSFGKHRKNTYSLSSQLRKINLLIKQLSKVC